MTASAQWLIDVGTPTGQVVDGLVNDLADNEAGWTKKDLLNLQKVDELQRISVLGSVHQRPSGLPDIELRHLWIEMD
jgi:hypothetical protein